MLQHSVAALSLALPLLAPATALAQARAFPLATAGCAMAHCDPRMSDGANTVSPASANLVAIDSASSGGAGGLGCASNTRIVACTRNGDPPAPSNFVAYDADGGRLWDDGGLLGPTAWMSAPIVGSDGSVIAADRNWVLRVNALARTIVWKSPKPDGGNPISPVLVGSDRSMVLVATSPGEFGKPAELSVWDAASGALLSHRQIVDPATGKAYVTRNTPAVRGDRAYVLASAQGESTDGRLYAIDVCSAPECGGRGTIALRWSYGFKGPSGSSPLLIGKRIYFDGRPNSRTGSFMAVADTGTAPKLLWKKTFSGQFVTSAAQDPRGGLWVYEARSGAVTRLNADTGVIEQTVVVSAALGLAPGYSACSVMSVSRSSTDAVVLTFGVRAFGQSGLPTYVAAIDVSSTPAGTASWRYQVAPNADTNATSGQYPIVISATGGRRIVFQGTQSSTFFVGEP